MKNLRKNKGITLIALIITIIILLILAGVTISLTLGENGLFKTAQQAAKNYIDAENKEKEDLYNFDNTIKDIVGGTNEETLFSQISPANYGDYVSGYGIDLGIATAGNAFSNGKTPVTDWRIFYKDETNVYLIASDYLPTSKYPAGVFGGNDGKYIGYWAASGSNLTTSGTVTTNNNFLFTKLSNVTNTNYNYQAAATLLDSSKWSKLANTSWVDNKDTAVIGSPTVEMWIKSWNQKYSDTLDFDANTTGYKVGLTADSLGDYISSSAMQGKTGFNETLYYPHGNTSGSSWNDCCGYWLASPSAYDAVYVMYVDYDGGVNSHYFHHYLGAYFGVRPVVSLSSGVKATKATTDGVTTWTLSD